MYKLFLIKKYSPQSPFWPNLLRKKNIDKLSINEIIEKYGGFEGDLISSLCIPENENKSKGFIFLCNITNNEKIPSCIQDKFILSGYDFGVCEEEYTLYSSIFNEILFGNIKELLCYKSKLNDHYLFPDETLARKYAHFHHQILLEGKDLEDDEEMNIYSIWKPRINEPLKGNQNETKVMQEELSSSGYFMKYV